jgi:hypothetical protein
MLEKAQPRFHEFPYRGIASIPGVGGVRGSTKEPELALSFGALAISWRSMLVCINHTRTRLRPRERFSLVLQYKTGTFLIA